MALRFRHSVRALLLDQQQSLLLYRFAVPGQDLVVWAAPGGGIEPGETPRRALERELDEELGYELRDEAPHVWHQRVESPDIVSGYDGIVNDYFLIRTTRFEPSGSLDRAALARELVGHFAWWDLPRLRTCRGQAVFSPRDLPTLIADLIANGPPARPIPLDL